MDPVKEAFSKVKQDIDYLKNQLESIKEALNSIQNPTQSSDKPTNTQQSNSSITNNLDLEALKPQNPLISSGNRGVPTDKQTNQQTHNNPSKSSFNIESEHIPSKISPYLQVSETLSQLDDLKKAIRQQFKVLTNQEMLVFSTLYQLEEQGFTVDYSLISQKLSLSESSIRDYILRIIKKGIPIQKTKENNKKVFLSISSDLKNIASLSTIIQLREL
jgi:hypothetical protein